MAKVVGYDEDYIYCIKYSAGKDHQTHKYLSFTHEDYMSQSISFEEGEEHYKEMLWDSDIWEQQAYAGQTTQSKEDWIEDVLRYDGWIGDEVEINTKNGTRYLSLSSCGASVTLPDYDDLLVAYMDREDYYFYKSVAKKLHLVPREYCSTYVLDRMIGIIGSLRDIHDFDYYMHSKKVNWTKLTGLSNDHKNPTRWLDILNGSEE